MRLSDFVCLCLHDCVIWLVVCLVWFGRLFRLCVCLANLFVCVLFVCFVVYFLFCLFRLFVLVRLCMFACVRCCFRIASTFCVCWFVGRFVY